MVATASPASTTTAVVRGYHDAWTSGDAASALPLLASEVRNPNPLNDYSDAPRPAAEYLAGIARFGQRLTRAEMVSELYGDDEATLVYDAYTTALPEPIRSAEHFRLVDGKIETILLIFDATPWHAMLAQQKPA